jgi:DNA-binding MarR family transcriptional regulator
MGRQACRTISVQTQAELVKLWQVRQPTVSQTLQPLIEAGAVEASPGP